MSAIFYVLRTGCQWNALSRSLGCILPVHVLLTEQQDFSHRFLIGFLYAILFHSRL